MQRHRICFVVTELLGLERNGGIGTAITHMSLVLAHQGHHVEVLHCGHRSTVEEPWASRYRDAGVTIRILDQSTPVLPLATALGFAAYQTLKYEDLDVIVFQDWRGLGAISCLAKQSGAAFARTRLVHHVHGPSDWLREANRAIDVDAEQLMVAHLERISGELADHVVGPSQYLLDWLLDHGWRLPESRTVIPYFTAGDVTDLDAPLEPPRASSALSELVFFGRLEERKGVRTFVDALARIAPADLAGLAVTFLGRPAHFSADEVRSWFPGALQQSLDVISFLTDLDQPAAREYLRQPGRLAVIPSLVDNSPNVVYECIEDRIPFIASRSGGTGELVHVDDREEILFDPTPSSLASRLAAIVGDRVVPQPPRPSYDGRSSLEAWGPLLGPPPERVVVSESPLVSVVIPTHDRPRLLREAVMSIVDQDYANLEIIVVDDGSETAEAVQALDRLVPLAAGRDLRIVRQSNRYLGAARNAGVQAAHGELVAFLDDDDLAARNYVSSMVRAAEASGADAVTCAFETVDGRHEGLPRPQDVTGVWVFLGGPVSLAPILNVLGGAGMLVRAATLHKVDGFHERHGVGHEDWELLVKIVLAGGRIITLPEPVYRYRQSTSSMIRTGNVFADASVVNAAYQEVLPPELRAFPEMLRGLHGQIEHLQQQGHELRVLAHEMRAELARRERYIALLERRAT